MPKCLVYFTTEQVLGFPLHPHPVCRCITHDWVFSYDKPTRQDSPLCCPVGKIEQAVEDGIAKIAAAAPAAPTKDMSELEFMRGWNAAIRAAEDAIVGSPIFPKHNYTGFTDGERLSILEICRKRVADLKPRRRD